MLYLQSALVQDLVVQPADPLFMRTSCCWPVFVSFHLVSGFSFRICVMFFLTDVAMFTEHARGTWIKAVLSCVKHFGEKTDWHVFFTTLVCSIRAFIPFCAPCDAEFIWVPNSNISKADLWTLMMKVVIYCIYWHFKNNIYTTLCQTNYYYYYYFCNHQEDYISVNVTFWFYRWLTFKIYFSFTGLF